jgi:hypothetical protein
MIRLAIMIFMVAVNGMYLEDNTWKSLWSWGLEPWQIEQWTGVANVSMMAYDGHSTIPGPRTHIGNDIYMPSGCSNGGRDSQGRSAYACPYTMLLSNDMIGAARMDGFEPTELVYAVAGASSDRDCGACYQIQLLDAEREWRNDFPLLVVQSINSGFDVMSYQLDIFMGAGGFGYFTACNSDCRWRACQGGGCAGEGMYDTNFDDWTSQAQFGDANNICYGGGIKWDTSAIDHTELVAKCKRLITTDNWRDSATLDSCVRSNEAMLHQNFVSSRIARVQCPQGLYRLTGMRRSDDDNFPLPSLTLPLDQQCSGDRSQGHYCVTTMQDCCKPSCSWPGKTSTDPNYPFVDACLRDGTLIVQARQI